MFHVPTIDVGQGELAKAELPRREKPRRNALKRLMFMIACIYASGDAIGRHHTPTFTKTDCRRQSRHRILPARRQGPPKRRVASSARFDHCAAAAASPAAASEAATVSH